MLGTRLRVNIVNDFAPGRFSNLHFAFREVGTIVRSLKCCPTEGELHDILAEVIKLSLASYIIIFLGDH